MSRIRTNLITNRMANGAPTVSNGLVISGVTTVTTLDVNGTVGIGSVTPANILDVQGSAHSKIHVGTTGTSHATGIQINHAKGNAALQEWQLQTDASADGNLIVRNATSGTSTMFFDADNNNVGINETNPGHKLTVGGDGYFGFTTPNDAARQIIFNVNRGSAGNTLANMNWQWNSKNVAQIRGIAGADTTNKDDGHLAFFTSAANSLVERLRITSAGKIGIGTDSPDSDAYIHIVGPDNGKIILEDNDNNGANLRKNYIGIQGSDNLILAADEADLGSSSSIRFRIDNTEKVIITSAGRVGIGTDSPTEQLEIYNGASSGNSTFRMRSLDGSTHLSLDARGTNASNMIYFTDSSAVYNSFINRSHSSNANFAGLKYAYNGSAHVAFRISESGGFEFGDSGNLSANSGNYGTSTSTYNSNTGKSKQALVTNGNAPPSWAYTNRPAFFARQNTGTSQTISHATWTKVNVDEEVLDTDGAYDPTTNKRFTVPTGGAGWYQCFFSCGVDDIQSGDYVYSRLYLNGSSIAHGIAMDWAASANAIIQATGSHMVYMDDGDYLELYIYHQEGTTEATEQSRCYFGAFRLNI